jgi:phosphatidylethanolamine/phosphatidyl-N-methylethanolamine N-methyltransferase
MCKKEREMTDHKDYNDRLFSRWAPVYDGFEIILHPIRDQVIRKINPFDKSVLDIATGTGSLAIGLSNSAQKVTGIDLSPKMLEVAKKKKRNSNLTFMEMDASEMKFNDNEFNIVTISLGLHDMPLKIRTLVLEEARRVLKKNGNLYILEYDLPETKFLKLISSWLINFYESKYYLEFINSDFDKYLNTFGFEIEEKQNFLFKYLRLIKINNSKPCT